MTVLIEKVEKQNKHIIENLMQFYQYDFTDFGGEHTNKQGKFTYTYLDSYWEDTDRHPFLVTYNGEIAGFSLVNTHSLLGNTDTYSIAEFFILRYLRNKKIGQTAAKQIIKTFPGKWEVSQTKENKKAQDFWLKLVKSLVNENFKRVELKEDQKIVLEFSTR